MDKKKALADFIIARKELCIRRIANSIGADQGNFSKYVKMREIPERFHDRLESTLSLYGWRINTEKRESWEFTNEEIWKSVANIWAKECPLARATTERGRALWRAELKKEVEELKKHLK